MTKLTIYGLYTHVDKFYSMLLMLAIQILQST